MASNVSRPLGVTLVVLVILLSGVLGVVGGILRLFNRGDNATVSVTSAIVTIIIGAIYLLVARGIAHGSRGARFLVAIITILSIAGGFWLTVTNLSSLSTVTVGVVQMLLGLVVLGLLYGVRARQFFGA